MCLVVGILTLSVAPAVAVSATPGLPGTALVRLPFPQDDGSLTPYSFDLGYSLMTLVYDTLLWRGPDGVLSPWLATSVDTSADRRQLTVHLTGGVQWQDGVALTAADVAFTFSYVASHPQARFSAEVADVVRAVATDPTTVVLNLRQPSSSFSQTTLGDLPILPEHLWSNLPVGQATPAGLPIGSGPYRLTAYHPGQDYQFQANLGYFKGVPTVRTIAVPIIHDLAGTLSALRQRHVDMVPLNLPQSSASQVNDLGTRLATGPDYLGTALAFNLRQAPFDLLQVRQAVSEAIDPVRIVRAVGDSVGADNGFEHPASSWATATIVHPVDPAASGALLAPLHLAPLDVLAPDNDPTQMVAANQVALALQRAGLQAAAQYLPEAAYEAAMGAGGAPSFSLAITTIDPQVSFDPGALKSDLAVTGYSSPAFDALDAKLDAAPDPASRRAVAADEETQLAADVPAVPLLFSNGAFAYHPASYDGWVYLKGRGILDKLSFLPGGRPSTPAVVPSSSVASTGGFPFAVLAWSTAAAAAVLAALLAASTVRSRRRIF